MRHGRNAEHYVGHAVQCNDVDDAAVFKKDARPEPALERRGWKKRGGARRHMRNDDIICRERTGKKRAQRIQHAVDAALATEDARKRPTHHEKEALAMRSRRHAALCLIVPHVVERNLAVRAPARTEFNCVRCDGGRVSDETTPSSGRMYRAPMLAPAAGGPAPPARFPSPFRSSSAAAAPAVAAKRCLRAVCRR